MIAALLLLDTKDSKYVEDENEYMYTGLIVLAEIVFLLIARQTDKRSRRGYIMVVFIAKENKKNEAVLHREEMFNDEEEEEDSEEETSDGDR